jgi:hypothetical protein
VCGFRNEPSPVPDPSDWLDLEKSLRFVSSWPGLRRPGGEQRPGASRSKDVRDRA